MASSDPPTGSLAELLPFPKLSNGLLTWVAILATSIFITCVSVWMGWPGRKLACIDLDEKLSKKRITQQKNQSSGETGGGFITWDSPKVADHTAQLNAISGRLNNIELRVEHLERPYDTVLEQEPIEQLEKPPTPHIRVVIPHATFSSSTSTYALSDHGNTTVRRQPSSSQD